MRVETKILDPNINLVAHCVRVPVFIGHSEEALLNAKILMKITLEAC